MTRSRWIGILLALTALATGCGGGRPPRPQAPKLRIGLLLDTLTEERWQRDRDLFVERAKELGADVLVQEANGDPARQEQQARDMLDKEAVKALVVVPSDTEKAAAIVQLAAAKHVPVISYDRLIRDADIALYVSFDNVKVGRMQAEYLLNKAPKGNYVLIGGSPTDNNAKLLRQGQMEMLRPAIAAASVKVVADPWADGWAADKARDETTAALKKAHNNVVAVVASNDTTAGGVVQALDDAKLDGKVYVSGQDADLAALRRIVQGTQTMTVYKPIRPLARMAAGAAVNMAKGQSEDGLVSINNGKKDVPARLLEPILVDKDDLDRTVIADGYHKASEVYQK
jgi:D-xylose transport system substrate-binding protein